MQRLYDFLRRHPTGVDSFWAALLFGVSLLEVTNSGLSSTATRLIAVPSVIAMSAVVALRRKWTVPMFWLAVGTGVYQLLTRTDPHLGDFGMLIILYTVAASADVSRRLSRVAFGIGLTASPLYFLRFHVDRGETGDNVIGALFAVVPFALAWVLGDSVRTRRAYYAQLVERNQRLEKEREAQAKAAVTTERARIARELHDVVAHNVSVMVVQADGAAYVMDAAPEQAKEALQTISGTGRQALAEMRRLLGVLRTGEPQESEDYVPQPDVEQIEVLVEQVRAAGLTVDFEVEGAPAGCRAGSN